MLLEGFFSVKASVRDLWELMIIPENIAGCIPGCEGIEEVGENEFSSIISAKVSFFSVRFKCKGNLKNLTPPNHFEIDGSGEDLTRLGNFKANARVDLKEEPDGHVKVSYKANVSVVGKLATLGDRVMRAKAKEVEREFTRALTEKLSGASFVKAELNTGLKEMFVILFSGLIKKIKQRWHNISRK